MGFFDLSWEEIASKSLFIINLFFLAVSMLVLALHQVQPSQVKSMCLAVAKPDNRDIPRETPCQHRS